MGYDFATPIERRGTGSIKWSRGEISGRWVPTTATGPINEVDLLPMWLSDMDFASAPEVLDALHATVERGVFGYATYSDEFYSAIASWNGRRHGWSPTAESILVNSGVMSAINLAIQTYTEPGDHVIAQPPVFHPITEAPTVNGRRTILNPLVLVDGQYRMDLDDLAEKAAHPRAKMMILCSPHNPVGRVWSAAELRQVAAICTDNDLLLVADEIHADLTYPWVEFTSSGVLGQPLDDRLILCTGPSKAFNLPAMKLAITVIPNPELRSQFVKTLNKRNELWSASLMGTVALEAAYTLGQPWHDALIAYLADNVAFIADYLPEHIPELRFEKPYSLYLAWIDCRRLGLSGDALTSRLRRAGLWIENGATYGEEGEGFIRLTYATPRSVLEEGLQRLATGLAS